MYPVNEDNEFCNDIELFVVEIKSIVKKQVYATNKEEAAEIIMDYYFDPSELKDKISVKVFLDDEYGK